MPKTYLAVPIDRTAYEANAFRGTDAFIEYTVRFTSDKDPSDTFDGRVQADGTDADLRAKIFDYLKAYVAPKIEDTVAPDASYSLAVDETGATPVVSAPAE